MVKRKKTGLEILSLLQFLLKKIRPDVRVIDIKSDDDEGERHTLVRRKEVIPDKVTLLIDNIKEPGFRTVLIEIVPLNQIYSLCLEYSAGEPLLNRVVDGSLGTGALKGKGGIEKKNSRFRIVSRLKFVFEFECTIEIHRLRIPLIPGIILGHDNAV